jgi:death-on-curing protein
MPDARFLTTEDVLAVADEFFAALGYARPILRDGGRALLESAVQRAQVFAFYEGAGIHVQAAALGGGIAQSQAFVDGNKRVAFAACVVFLRVNGVPLGDDAYDALAEKIIALPTFPSRSEAEQDLARWLSEHTD